MKYNMNRVLSIVALLMLTIGMWAGGNVTINKYPSNSAGNVESDVSEGVCTLTVTPANGYCASLENIIVELTVNGNVAQTPRRSSDIPNIKDPVEVEALTPNANPSGETKYKFTFPADNTYDAEVTVVFQPILSIGGVVVTEENCGDILGDKKVSYNTATNTLTLNGATLTPNNDGWCVSVGKALSYLNVNLVGSNTISGNAFKFAISNPALLFTTDEFNPGSLQINGQSYSLISPEIGDNGATVVYKNGLVQAVAEAGIAISANQTNLKVGGTTVTSQNMGNILNDGKVSFNVRTKTLTLNGATIDMTGKDGFPIESDVDDLKVLMIGTNTFTANGTSAYGFKYTGTSNTAKLTFEHEKNGFGSLTVSGGTLAEGYNVTYDTNEEGWVKTDNDIRFEEVYGVQIGSTKFTASKLTINGTTGSATYNPVSETLSLNNFTTNDDITTTLTTLTIELTGVNSVGAITNSGTGIADTIAIERNLTSEAAVNKLVASSLNGFETVTVVDPLQQLTATQGVTISDVVTYKLWVNGIQVTKENLNAGINGVSFDGDHTLTLTRVNTTCDDAPFITNGLSTLTIHLVGTNAVDCGQQVFLAKKEGDNDHQASFTTDGNAVGKLTIKVSESNSWYTGHSKVTLLNKLQEDSNVEGTVKTVTIQAPEAEYGLTIAGTAVTNLNANDVFKDGSVKYDATTKVLMLNGATISGDIISDIDELFIQLNGNCEVNAFGRTVSSQGKLKFSLGGDQGKLTLTAAISTEKFEVTTTDRLTFNNDGTVLALPTSYGITVAGITIDSENRLHVLGEGNKSVIFDNNAQLILNNATINGEIVVGNASALPDNTLTINFNGENNINLANTEKAVKCNNGTLKLKFVVGDQYSAFLYINDASGQATEANVFEGVTVSYGSLNAYNNDDNTKLTISAYLPAIVNNPNQVANVNFQMLPPSTNTNNQTINNILVTLGDESSNKDNAGGIDQTQNALVFVGAAAMTEEDLKDVLDKQPGTEAYADSFTGLTFAVPSGSSIVTIESYIADPNYAFYIQVGDQDPVEIESGTITNSTISMAVTSLKIAVAQAGVVKLFIMEKKPQTTTAPQMAQRRIGPKSSVAGGLGGITVSNSSMQMSSGPSNTYKSMEKSVVANSIAAITSSKDGFVCNDENITDLPDNMFVKANSSNAPSRRGAAVETILPEGLTFVDFSNTKITGMEVSRTSGPFNGVPENVFIYMPAGNTTKEKNVVIGDICDKMELDGTDDAQPFKAMKNFKAGQATLNRTFAAGSDVKKATIYLPYAIPQEDADKLGFFYEFNGIDNQNVVQMTKVSTGGLKANKPYIFQAKEGGVKDLQVRVVDVYAKPVETDGFKGVFERQDYEDGMYCYVGKADGKHEVGEFVEMGQNSWVPPFRAYIIGNGAPSYAIAWDGIIDTMEAEQDVTAIETPKDVKTVQGKKVAEGWWTLNGSRLNGKPQKSGLYIKDGKLVVVKN